MYYLVPGESTTSLTEMMTMINITYPEYASIETKDFEVLAYVIGIEDVDTSHLQAWEVCRTLGNIE